KTEGKTSRRLRISRAGLKGLQAGPKLVLKEAAHLLELLSLHPKLPGSLVFGKLGRLGLLFGSFGLLEGVLAGLEEEVQFQFLDLDLRFQKLHRIGESLLRRHLDLPRLLGPSLNIALLRDLFQSL